MHTYPVLSAGGAPIRAFEIDPPYITTRAITRLLAATDGVSDIRRRSLARDIKIEFTFRSRPYVVWEQDGGDGRYWIGPDSEAAFGEDVLALRAAFERYRPPLLRALYGSFVTCWLFSRPPKKRHSHPANAG